MALALGCAAIATAGWLHSQGIPSVHQRPDEQEPGPCNHVPAAAVLAWCNQAGCAHGLLEAGAEKQLAARTCSWKHMNSPRRRSRGCGSCTGWARRRSAPSGPLSGRSRRSAPCPVHPPCGSCPRPLCARCPCPCPTCCRQAGQQLMISLKSLELPQYRGAVTQASLCASTAMSSIHRIAALSALLPDTSSMQERHNANCQSWVNAEATATQTR